MTKPWEHQTNAINFCKDKKSSLLNMDMGTGKSYVAIKLAEHWTPQKILVICPINVTGVWRREFAKHSFGNYHVTVAEGLNGEKISTPRKEYVCQTGIDVAFCKNMPSVSVVNYESVWRSNFGKFVLRQKFDLVILDESHRIKSAGGKASRFCAKLRKDSSHILALTGTPTPHSPLDVYGLFRSLDPEIYGTSFHRFKQRYAVFGGYENRKVLGYKSQEEFRRKFESITFTVKKEDALDLPDYLHVEIPVILDSSLKIYKGLEKDFYVQVEAGDVSVSNALVKLLRLQQITSGFLKTDEGKLTKIGDEKRIALLELLSDISLDKCVVVFCRFRSDIENVKDIAGLIGRKYGEISGQRKDLTDTAEIPEGIKLMAVQISSGGVGIDLTESDTAIYYSLGFSLGEYLQSLARLHRPGQKNKVTFYHLISQGTVDVKIYNALQARQDVISEVLNNKKMEVCA